MHWQDVVHWIARVPTRYEIIKAVQRSRVDIIKTSLLNVRLTRRLRSNFIIYPFSPTAYSDVPEPATRAWPARVSPLTQAVLSESFEVYDELLLYTVPIYSQAYLPVLTALVSKCQVARVQTLMDSGRVDLTTLSVEQFLALIHTLEPCQMSKSLARDTQYIMFATDSTSALPMTLGDFTFVFVNIDEKALAVYRAVLQPIMRERAMFIVGSIADNVDACEYLVSASNSRLFFDGGSDMDYLRMYPEVTDAARKQMRLLWNEGAFLSDADVPHLPVGAAMLVPLSCGRTLIAAPTMILPQNVSDTDNARSAFSAILTVLEKEGDGARGRVLVPGLCTGVGGMSATASAVQVTEAWHDFHSGITTDICPQFMGVAHDPGPMRRQPSMYVNSLFVTNGCPRVTQKFGACPLHHCVSNQHSDQKVWW
ncbi:hypothetical protein JKP88DRAFT_255633 [Tribonema minus]|uniref:Macro domain-containing protein n=1 Tax=Tribonema minus TaxID=303371 RepID=A0A836CEV3_9STRA|nr:hypothetical protein JKP88DRAFT_255633 [Tribonema minus]